MKHLLLN